MFTSRSAESAFSAMISAPALNAFSLSLGSLVPVRMTTGMCFRSASFLSSSHTTKPFMPGISMSRRMASGGCFLANVNPSGTAGRHLDPESLLLQDVPEHGGEERLVVDDEHRCRMGVCRGSHGVASFDRTV